jgi:hypothetical protein
MCAPPRSDAGCDGSHSTVRDTIGTAFPGGTYRQVFYVADVEAADLSLTGFDEFELGELFAERTQGRTDPDDAPEPPAHPVAEPGDLWVLGYLRGRTVQRTRCCARGGRCESLSPRRRGRGGRACGEARAGRVDTELIRPADLAFPEDDEKRPELSAGRLD